MMKGLGWFYLILVTATTAAVCARLWAVLRVDGLTSVEVLYFALVVILFWWISASFWLAAIGAYSIWRGVADVTLKRPLRHGADALTSPSRTALLFPVRNEEPARLFAGIAAVRESVRESGLDDKFAVFVLSDSNTPEQLAQEAQSCARLRQTPGCEVYYRYRRENTGRKSGNIAQFCRNWGASYDYMVVLDADSLMSGETLARLANLMDANPRAALIQAVPKLVGRESLFARIQQFSSSVYGPLYAAGMSLLSGAGGNYWGHNAIIRIAPFMRHCGLPKLPGRAPLGGEIMSHDFVEAALLRRAGWNLHLVCDLDGSYEEPPPTIADYLARDRRWCQGNLQHIKLLFAQGLRSESRGHLAMGIMSYLASPLWLALFVVSLYLIARTQHVPSVTYIGSYPVLSWRVHHDADLLLLISSMLAMLFLPKLFALLLLLRRRGLRRMHGGGWHAVAGVLLECVFSTLLAPIMMLSQSIFVASILLGRAGGWRTQQRQENRLDIGGIARSFAGHTVFAILVGVAVFFRLHGSFWWTVPLLLGPLLSIPLAAASASRHAGRLTRRCGLFVTPEELGMAPIVNQVRRALTTDGIGVSSSL